MILSWTFKPTVIEFVPSKCEVDSFGKIGLSLNEAMTDLS